MYVIQKAVRREAEKAGEILLPQGGTIYEAPFPRHQYRGKGHVTMACSRCRADDIRKGADHRHNDSTSTKFI